MTSDPAYADEPTKAAEPAGARVVLLGATGTIGRAVHAVLHDAGYHVICPQRVSAKTQARHDATGAPICAGDLTSRAFWQTVLCEGDIVISCIASRTGAPKDAWAVDYGINSVALEAGKAVGLRQFVMLSAICVQQPLLGFQQAKLAFEAELAASGICHSVVRPTAFFKSLSGQVTRLRQGKPFLVFGDGQVTACKPISDADLARFVVRCITEPACHNRILPVGGPGPAVTPLEQGRALCAALDRAPVFRHVPLRLMGGIIAGLGALGLLSGRARDKAELARIGQYYATHSMLVWDAQAQRYDADATPEFGRDTLAAHYARLARGEVQVDLGEHAVF